MPRNGADTLSLGLVGAILDVVFDGVGWAFGRLGVFLGLWRCCVTQVSVGVGRISVGADWGEFVCR